MYGIRAIEISMLEEICKDLIPEYDTDIVNTLLSDASLVAELEDNEELYFAYIKVISEYVSISEIAELRKRMIDYWKETEDERNN